MRALKPTLIRRAAGACCLTLTAACAFGFDVVKNINSGKPQVAFVLFDKASNTPELELKSTPGGEVKRTADGSIDFHLTGSGAANPTVSWKAAGDVPATFNAADYSGMLVTCRFEGVMHRKFGNKIIDQSGDNLWLSLSLINNKGESVGLANPADITDDRKSPRETTELFIPMLYFVRPGFDSTHISAFGFPVIAGRPENDRDFHVIIEKIALVR